MATRTELTRSDGVFLLDSLRHVVSPVVINAGEIATKKAVKVNTIIKRFSDIKKRYNIKIQTTAVGYSAAKKPAAAGKSPGKITKRPSGGSKVKVSSVRKAALEKAMAGEDWYSSDEEAARGNLLHSLSDAEPWNSSFVGGSHS